MKNSNLKKALAQLEAANTEVEMISPETIRGGEAACVSRLVRPKCIIRFKKPDPIIIKV